VAYEVFFRALGKSSSLEFAKKVGLETVRPIVLLDIARGFDVFLDEYERAIKAIKSDEQAKIATMQEQKERFLSKELGRLPTELGSTAAAGLGDYIRTRIKSRIKKIPLAAIASEAGSVYTYSDSWSADGFIYGVSVLVPEKAADVKDMVFEASTTIIAPDGVRSSSGQTEGSPAVVNIHRLPIGKDDGEYTIKSSFEAERDSLTYHIGSSIQTFDLAATVGLNSNVVVDPRPPATIAGRNGSATITVSIWTTLEVPQGAKADIELDEQSNFSSISYSVSPSRGQTVELEGRGNSTTVSWTITTTINNQNGGDIVSLIVLTNAYIPCPPSDPNCTPQQIIRANPTDIRDIKVSVAPPSDSCPEFCSVGGVCVEPVDYCLYPWPDDGCPSFLTEQVPGCCCLPSPIVVDIEGDNFDLTDAVSGVRFDIGGNGGLDQVAWTAPGSDDAWLVMDRDGNGGSTMEESSLGMPCFWPVEAMRSMDFKRWPNMITRCAVGMEMGSLTLRMPSTRP